MTVTRYARFYVGRETIVTHGDFEVWHCLMASSVAHDRSTLRGVADLYILTQRGWEGKQAPGRSEKSAVGESKSTTPHVLPTLNSLHMSLCTLHHHHIS